MDDKHVRVLVAAIVLMSFLATSESEATLIQYEFDIEITGYIENHIHPRPLEPLRCTAAEEGGRLGWRHEGALMVTVPHWCDKNGLQ